MADSWAEKLDIYLDGELPADQMSALDTHVRGCSECAADVLRRLQLKRAVQTTGKRYSPSLELRQRIQQIVGTRPRQSWIWQIVAVAAVALVVATLFLVKAGRANQAQQKIYSEIADLHVANLASSSPVDVISSDRHTVKPWFEGKIPFTFNLPELANSEFTLVGGRVTYFEQEPGAHLIFQIRKHRISVLIFQERSFFQGLPDSQLGKQATFEVENWTQGDLRYFIIGDAAADDIAKLTELLKTSGRQ